MDLNISANSTVNSTDTAQSLAEEFSKGLVLSVITLATVLANSLSLFALNMTGKYSIVYLITNLAVTDFILGLLVMPFTTATAITVQWIFGDFWCQVQACLGFLLCQVSVTTITLVSIERFIMFTKPNKHFKFFRSSSECMKFFVSSTWIYGGLWTFLAWQISRFSFTAPELLNCAVDWQYNRRFTVACGAITSCLPILIIICCNFKVVRILQKWNTRLKVISAQDIENAKRNAAEAKTTRMLMIVVAAFLLCWFPYSLGGLCYLLPECSLPRGFYEASVFLCLFNSCVNPIIYGTFNRRFRRAVGHIVWRMIFFRRNTNINDSNPPTA